MEPLPAIASLRFAPLVQFSSVRKTPIAAGRYYHSKPSPLKAFPDRPSALSFLTPCAPKKHKQCTDCHVSAADDNNAWLAQVLLQGTGFMNFEGRYIYVATGKGGYHAIAVAEHEEPASIFGSDFHTSPIPTDYEKFVRGGSRLRQSYGHARQSSRFASPGEYLTPQWEKAACASSTSPTSMTRIFRAHNHRPRIAARPAFLRKDQIRTGRRFSVTPGR